uniref:Cyclin-like domain-containing protein n=1 Tax=Cannabis sativa TaxID=3483 RepID=A0A803P746_CANSA
MDGVRAKVCGLGSKMGSRSRIRIRMWCSHCQKDCPTTEETGRICCDFCGRVISDAFFTEEPSFVKGPGGESHLSGNFVKSIASSVSDSFRRTLEKGRDEIRHIVLLLNMDEAMVGPSFSLYKMAVERNFTRGRRTTQVAAACIYIACRTSNPPKPYLLIDFSEALSINVYVVGATFLQLCQLLSLGEHNIIKRPIDPTLFIPRFTENELPSSPSDSSSTSIFFEWEVNSDSPKPKVQCHHKSDQIGGEVYGHFVWELNRGWRKFLPASWTYIVWEDVQDTLPMGQLGPLKRSSVQAEVAVTVVRHNQISLFEAKSKLAHTKQTIRAISANDPHIARPHAKQGALLPPHSYFQKGWEMPSPHDVNWFFNLKSNPHHNWSKYFYVSQLEFAWLTGTTYNKVFKIGGYCPDYYIAEGVEAYHFSFQHVEPFYHPLFTLALRNSTHTIFDLSGEHIYAGH